MKMKSFCNQHLCFANVKMVDSQLLIQVEDSSLECRSECCTLFDKSELADKHIGSSKHKFDMQNKLT